MFLSARSSDLVLLFNQYIHHAIPTQVALSFQMAPTLALIAENIKENATHQQLPRFDIAHNHSSHSPLLTSNFTIQLVHRLITSFLPPPYNHQISQSAQPVQSQQVQLPQFQHIQLSQPLPNPPAVQHSTTVPQTSGSLR